MSGDQTVSPIKDTTDLFQLLSILPSNALAQTVDSIVQQNLIDTLEQPITAESFLQLKEQERNYAVGIGALTLPVVEQLWHVLDMQQRGFILASYDTITPDFLDRVELDEGMMKLLCATRKDLVKQTKQRLRVLLTTHLTVPEISVSKTQAAR